MKKEISKIEKISFEEENNNLIKAIIIEREDGTKEELEKGAVIVFGKPKELTEMAEVNTAEVITRNMKAKELEFCVELMADAAERQTRKEMAVELVGLLKELGMDVTNSEKQKETNEKDRVQ